MPVSRFEINFEYRSQCPDCGIETTAKVRQFSRCRPCQDDRQRRIKQLRAQFQEQGYIPQDSPLALRCHDCGAAIAYVPRSGSNSDRCGPCRKELAKLLRKVKAQNRLADTARTAPTIAGAPGEPCPRCRHPHGVHSDGEYAICVNCSYQPDLATDASWTFSPVLAFPRRFYRRSAGDFDRRARVQTSSPAGGNQPRAVNQEVANTES